MASADRIPPGGEGKISVTFATKGRKGTQTKSINVTTNDPTQTKIVLDIKADIIIQFGFEPSKAVFGRATADKLEPLTLKASGEKLGDIQIRSTKITNPDHVNYYTIKLNDVGKGPERQLDLIITPSQSIPVGRFNDVLEIETNLENEPKIEVYIVGEILGPIDLRPRSVTLQSVGDNQPLSGELQLIPTGTRRFTVVSAKCNDSRLTFDIGQPDPEGMVKIIMTLPVDFAEPTFNQEIMIHTDLQDQPEIKVYAHWNKDHQANLQKAKSIGPDNLHSGNAPQNKSNPEQDAPK